MFETRSKIFIFFVDHSTEYSNSLIRSIENQSDYEIRSFASGEKFIAFLNQMTFRKKDIYITFLGYQFFDEGNQTLMNGIEILESAKVINKNIEVVMLTGEDESEYGSYVMKSGAYTFIPKNENIYLRINNIIMAIISKTRLDQKRIEFKISLQLLIGYIILLIITGILYTLFSK